MRSDESLPATAILFSKEPKSPRIVITAQVNAQRRRNAEVYSKDLQEGKLERGKWVAYSDGKLARVGRTQAEAVTGLPLGYYCTLVGRDPNKVTILLTGGERKVESQIGGRVRGFCYDPV